MHCHHDPRHNNDRLKQELVALSSLILFALLILVGSMLMGCSVSSQSPCSNEYVHDLANKFQGFPIYEHPEPEAVRILDLCEETDEIFLAYQELSRNGNREAKDTLRRLYHQKHDSLAALIHETYQDLIHRKFEGEDDVEEREELHIHYRSEDRSLMHTGHNL